MTYLKNRSCTQRREKCSGPIMNLARLPETMRPGIFELPEKFGASQITQAPRDNQARPNA